MRSRESLDRVPVEPFQERFRELEARGLISRGEIARALGWYRRPSPSSTARDTVQDTGRVSRTLGLATAQARRSVSYELGVQLCRILGMDPHEAGV
jgi:hypothetical protein